MKRWEPRFKEPMRIVYHGTNKANAMRILKTGFNKGTYFACHLEDAIGYGGVYIFEVIYPSKEVQETEGQWQIITAHHIDLASIVTLTKYNKANVLTNNETLRIQVCMSNDSLGVIRGTRKHMKTHPEMYTIAERKAYGVKDEKDN